MADDTEHFPLPYLKGDIIQRAEFAVAFGFCEGLPLPPGYGCRDSITQRVMPRRKTDGVALGQTID
jgi:hypothetical protein